MRRSIGSAAAFVALMFGCSETGDPAEYDKIEAVSDCDQLRGMLDEYNAAEQRSDEAGDDGSADEFRAYGDAVERRLETLDCN